MSVQSIGTPAEFQHEVDEQAAYLIRRRDQARRLAALPAAQQAAFIAWCRSRGVMTIDADEEDDFHWATTGLIRATLGDIAADDDPAYRRHGHAIMDEIDAWCALA